MQVSHGSFSLHKHGRKPFRTPSSAIAYILLLKLWRMPELLFKREEVTTLAYFTSVNSVYNIIIMGITLIPLIPYL